MPRLPRRAAGQALVHVVNRGNDRRRLFAAPKDYLQFVAIAASAQRRTDLQVLGYVVMPNHWHVVAWPESSAQLSQFMQRLTAAHAAVVRSATRTVGHGHVYQGRYHLTLVNTERQLLNTLRYVEANPVRAGLVERAEFWRWSSLDERLGSPRLISEPPVRLPPLPEWMALVNEPRVDVPCSALPRRPRRGVAIEWMAHDGAVEEHEAGEL